MQCRRVQGGAGQGVHMPKPLETLELLPPSCETNASAAALSNCQYCRPEFQLTSVHIGGGYRVPGANQNTVSMA